MFSISTFYALEIMAFLALNYGERSVSTEEAAGYCFMHAKLSEEILDELKCKGLVSQTSGKENTYFLSKPPYDIRLSDIIVPLEATLFMNYMGEQEKILPSNKARMLYQKFRPFQHIMEKKLRRCRLSEWVLMDHHSIHDL